MAAVGEEQDIVQAAALKPSLASCSSTSSPCAIRHWCFKRSFILSNQNSHRLKKSGHLVDALSSPAYTVQGSSADSFSATATVPLYLRFLDGILAETKRRIQYGFTDEVLQSLRQQLIKVGATLA